MKDDKTQKTLLPKLTKERQQQEEPKASVTKQRKSKVLINASELRYRCLFEAAQDGILLLDAETAQIVDVNPFLIEMLGYSKAEFLGKRLWEIGAFRDIEAAKLVFAKLQSEHYIRYEDMPLEAKNGKLLSVEFVSNVYDVDHKKVIQCNIRDITKRKKAEETVQKSEERYRYFLENANDMIQSVLPDGHFSFVNRVWLETLGYIEAELPSLNLFQIIHPESLAYCRELFARVIAGESVDHVQAKFVTKGGNTIQVEGNAHGYLLNGKVMETHGIFHDITGRKIAQEALAQAIERESSVSLLASKLVSSASIEDISELVLESARRITCSAFGFVGYIDSETGYLVTPTLSREIWESCQVKDKSIVFKKFQGLWGWVLNNRQSLLTNAPSSDSRSIGIPPGHIAINNFLSAPAMTDRELVGQVALANSSRSYNEQDLAFVERLATLYAVAVQRIRMENTISRLAYHDSLTGLPNRTLFNDRVTMAISRANRYRQRIALMLLDMDRFKDINDTLGHDAGDQLLRDFSNRMVSILRKTDTVSRIGGDEFLLLLPDVIDAEYVDIVAQKILEAARKPYMFHDREVMVTVSIGIAIYPEDGEDVDILIKHADSDMYQVKGQGRNNYQRYAPRMSTLTQQLQ